MAKIESQDLDIIKKKKECYKFHKIKNTDIVLRMAHCAKQLRSDNHCSHVRSLHREEVPPPWVPVPLAGYVPTTQLISLIHYGLQIVSEEVFLLEKKVSS
jgi:hypothetical protein